MTMSHLLKQTKKCCVKIIRKLSLNSSTTATGGGADQSPTNHGHGLNNRITAKYVLHTNCTPTRCKVQPCCDGTAATVTTVFEEHPAYGWPSIDEQGSVDGSTVNRAGFRPLTEEPPPPMESSLPNIPETQNNYKLSRNVKNLPKKRTNITSNKNVNLRKCFRLRSKTFDGPLAAVVATAGNEGATAEPVQQQHSRPAVMPTTTTSATTTTTEGATEREPTDSSTLASNNSSSRLIGARLDKISKSLMLRSTSVEATGHGMTGGTGDEHHHHPHLHGLAAVAKRSKPLFLTSNKHRRSNYNHIDAADDDDDDDDDDDEFDADNNETGRGFDEVLIEELGEGQARWRRSVYYQDQESGLTLASIGIGGGSRRSHGPADAELTEQETTLTDPSPAVVVPSVLERLTVAETAAAILFEKVKYDRTKRYLIDQLGEPDGGSPVTSTSPAGSASSIGAFHGLSSSCSSSPFHLAIAAAAAKSEDFVDPWKNYNIRGGASGDKVSKSPWDHQQQQQSLGKTQKAATPVMSVSPTPAVTTSYTPVRSHWNPFEYSPAHLARLSSQKQQQQQQQQQPVLPKQQQQYRPAFQVQTDVWENLNNKHYEIDTDVVWRSTRCSSRRTSASTVETWIDDETFDNSFNEELERRCATLQICE